MKALLLVAHGSRRPASNQEVHAMAQRVQALAGERFQWIGAAFLELAEPSIPVGIAQCVQAGAEEIVIMPYFLSAGRHVTQDVPALVAEGQAAHPQVSIRFAPYLGAAETLPQLILQTLASERCLCGRTTDDCYYPTCTQA